MKREFDCGCILIIEPDSMQYELCNKHEKLFGNDDRPVSKKVKEWLGKRSKFVSSGDMDK